MSIEKINLAIVSKLSLTLDTVMYKWDKNLYIWNYPNLSEMKKNTLETSPNIREVNGILWAIFSSA